MADFYKLQYAGNTLTYPGWNGYVMYESAPAFKTLTLCASEGGTVTASVLTGLPGDTVTLTPTYNTYYRFNNYSVTGGTIAGNTFTFGNEDATVQANFKVNYFTATGNFEKGSNVTAKGAGDNTNKWIYADVPKKYALYVGHTGEIPTSWYSTSNRWKPNDASAYSITLNSIMKFNGDGTGRRPGRAAATAVTLFGSTQTALQTYETGANNFSVTWNYNETVTTTEQNIEYGLSGRVGGYLFYGGYVGNGTATYVATGTTGTWTATGIAP
jgi:hypothetical protein